MGKNLISTEVCRQLKTHTLVYCSTEHTVTLYDNTHRVPVLRMLTLWTRSSLYRCSVLISVVPDPPFNQTFSSPFRS